MPAWRRAWPAVLTIAVVLSGCSTDGDPGASDDDSPLAAYLGPNAVSFEGGGMSVSLGGNASESFELTEEQIQQMRVFEDDVAACMRDQGFEYIANVVTDVGVAGPWAEAYALPPDEFAEQYGYGVSTLRWEDFADTEDHDPNRAIREALSDEARAEYERVLYGAEQSWDEETGPPAPEDQGCYGIASAEIFGWDGDDYVDPWLEYDAVLDDLWTIGDRMRNDPRVVEATAAWRDCIADAGYPEFEHVGDPQQSVFQRLHELEGWDDMYFEELDDEGAGEPRDFEPREIDPADLAELKEYELAVAAADFACMDEHYTEIGLTVQYEMEAEFVEQHKADLEALRDLLAEQHGAFG